MAELLHVNLYKDLFSNVPFTGLTQHWKDRTEGLKGGLEILLCNFLISGIRNQKPNEFN